MTGCRTMTHESNIKAAKASPDSREMMKPIRTAGSCGRSLTHCPKLLVGAYFSTGGAAGVAFFWAGAGAGAGEPDLAAGAGAVASCAKELQHHYHRQEFLNLCILDCGHSRVQRSSISSVKGNHSSGDLFASSNPDNQRPCRLLFSRSTAHLWHTTANATTPRSKMDGLMLSRDTSKLDVNRSPI